MQGHPLYETPEPAGTSFKEKYQLTSPLFRSFASSERSQVLSIALGMGVDGRTPSPSLSPRQSPAVLSDLKIESLLAFFLYISTFSFFH